MDANGLRFWLLADAAHWPSRSHTAWHAECRHAAPRLRAAARPPRSTPPRSPPPTRRWKSCRARSISTRRSRAGIAGAAPSSSAATCPAMRCGCRCPSAERSVRSGRTACCTSRSPTACTCTTCAAAGPTRRCGSPDSRRGGSKRMPAVSGCSSAPGGWRDSPGAPLPRTTPQRDDYAPGVFRPDPENCRPPALRLLDGRDLARRRAADCPRRASGQRPRRAVVVRRRRSRACAGSTPTPDV